MSELEFVNLTPDDYERAKTVLNKAKHPGFVGRELFYRCTTRGVVIAAEKVQALSVDLKFQGRGVGQALVNRLKPKWVNAIGERIGFFEKLGYKALGAPKVGQNGKHSTQLMQRDESAEVADTPIKETPTIEAPTIEAPSYAELAAAGDMIAQIDAELRLIDKMIAAATASEKFETVIKLSERAEYLHNRRKAESA